MSKMSGVLWMANKYNTSRRVTKGVSSKRLFNIFWRKPKIWSPIRRSPLFLPISSLKSIFVNRIHVVINVETSVRKASSLIFKVISFSISKSSHILHRPDLELLHFTCSRIRWTVTINVRESGIFQCGNSYK
jgi:hypothetical protein